MNLKDAIARTHQGYRRIGQSIGLSTSAVSNLVNFGEYPTRSDHEDVKRKLSSALAKHGVTPADIDWPRPGLRPGYGRGVRRPELNPVATLTALDSHQITSEDIDLMQLDRSVLSLFGLRVNPFLNDVEEECDVFQSKGYQAVSQAIRDAIDQRGFIAISAPSGAGKTTIWDGIENEYGTRDDVVICKPALKYKERLSPEHLCRALIYGLAGDDVKIPRDAEDRGRFLSAALRAVRSGAIDRKAVLYIDDAHFCNASVLRQLKTFFEEKIGRFRLLTIVLVGLPTMKNKLAEFPEIGNRIRLVEVPPVSVKEYLDFKLKRVGSSIDKIFTADGLDAFLDRFRAPKRPALAHPLIINATCIRAMVKLSDNGGGVGERITREIVDQLPGQAPARRVA